MVFSSHDTVREILQHDKADGRIQFENIRDRHNDKNLGTSQYILIYYLLPNWYKACHFIKQVLRNN